MILNDMHAFVDQCSADCSNQEAQKFTHCLENTGDTY